MPDLATLLDEAAPNPRSAVDVDAVLDRGDRLGRRRTVAATLATVVALLAVTGVVAELADQPDLPVVGDGPADAAPGPRPGTYADGAVVIGTRGQSPTLDMRVDAALDGVPLATIDGTPDELAVAADGTVGVLQGSMVRVLRDGEVVREESVLADLADSDLPGADRAPRDVAQLTRRDLSLAFGADGTLWLNVPGPGGALVGYDLVGGGRLMGSTPDDDVQRLRIRGDAVSVVTHDPDDRGQRATVTSVFGSDPLEGVQEVPLALHDGVKDRGTSFDDDAVVTTSVQGAGRVLLEGTPPIPSGEPGGVTFSLWSTPMVADTKVAIVSRTGFDDGVLIAHRADGTTVGVLVADVQPPDDLETDEHWLSIAPGGAIHLASTTPDGDTEVRTLLGPDLLPATAVPAPTDVPTIEEVEGVEEVEGPATGEMSRDLGFDVRLRASIADADGPPSQTAAAARRDQVPTRLAALPTERRVASGPSLPGDGDRRWQFGSSSVLLEPMAPDCTGPALCAGQYTEALLVDSSGEVVVAHALPGPADWTVGSSLDDGALVAVAGPSELTGDVLAYRLGTTPGDRTVIVFPGADSFYLPHDDPTPLRGVLRPEDLPDGWVVADPDREPPSWARPGAATFGPTAEQLDELAAELGG